MLLVAEQKLSPPFPKEHSWSILCTPLQHMLAMLKFDVAQDVDPGETYISKWNRRAFEDAWIDNNGYSVKHRKHGAVSFAWGMVMMNGNHLNNKSHSAVLLFPSGCVFHKNMCAKKIKQPNFVQLGWPEVSSKQIVDKISLNKIN